MADVLEVKRKHYSGLDADKAGITGVLGDTYAANDSGKAYYWNDSLNAWKTGLGYEYVPRSVALVDFAVGDFVTDGTWKIDSLDLTGIVPAGAVAVHFKVYMVDNAAGSVFHLRKNAVDVENMVSTFLQVANMSTYTQQILAIDLNRLVDYYGSNLAFTNLDVTVVGWFI